MSVNMVSRGMCANTDFGIRAVSHICWCTHARKTIILIYVLISLTITIAKDNTDQLVQDTKRWLEMWASQKVSTHYKTTKISKLVTKMAIRAEIFMMEENKYYCFVNLRELGWKRLITYSNFLRDSAVIPSPPITESISSWAFLIFAGFCMT